MMNFFIMLILLLHVIVLCFGLFIHLFLVPILVIRGVFGLELVEFILEIFIALLVHSKEIVLHCLPRIRSYTAILSSSFAILSEILIVL